MESGHTHADMIAVSGVHPDMAAAERLAANPERNANLRTTCVATILKAGTAENALADTAQPRQASQNPPPVGGSNFPT